MDHDTFLKEIIADPENDFPRLVYADWLEERGDVRSEFIRAQCELPKLDPTDDRWWELKVREQLLLAEYRKEWLPNPAGQVNPKHCFFRGGFVERLQVNPNFYRANSKVLHTSTPFNSIRFNGDAQKLKELRSVQIPETVRSLGLFQNELCDPVVLSWILNSLNAEQLTCLELVHVKPPSGSLFRTLLNFETLQNLRTLSIPGVQGQEKISAQMIQSAVEKMPKIEELNLDRYGTGLSRGRPANRGWAAFLNSPWATQVKTFSLNHVEFPSSPNSDPFQELFCECGLPRLESLSLRWSYTKTDFRNPLTLDQLKSLKLSRNRENKRGSCLSDLLEKSTFPVLHTLDLSESLLDETDLLTLSTCSSLPNLRRLTLAWNNVSAESLAQFFMCPLQGQLRELNLSQALAPGLSVISNAKSWNREVPSSIVEALARSPFTDNLIHLDLSHQEITDHHLQCLIVSPYFKNLRSLNLQSTACTRTGIRALLDSDFLSRLKLLVVPSEALTKGLRRRFLEHLGVGFGMTLNTGWSDG